MPNWTHGMTKLLFLLPGPAAPVSDNRLNRFLYLSQVCEGDVLLPVWYDSEETARRKMGVDSVPHKTVGKFRYTFLYSFRYHPKLRSVAALLFFLIRGRALLKSDRYDAVVSYGTSVTGLAGAILSRLLGIPLITEIPGVPDKAVILDSPRADEKARLKKMLSDKILEFVVNSSTGIQLLFPTQLPSRLRSCRARKFVFHAFVPVSAIAPAKEEAEILLVGYPWYLKGVDILCGAFHAVKDEIPSFKLVIMGHYPDKEALIRNIGSTDRIEILNPVPYPEALRQIATCAFLVLPSRTEAMGRVLLEAMAAGRPVIGSRVDGIPFYIDDGETGLLFESENVEQLSDCLKMLSLNEGYRHRLGEQAQRHCRSVYSEECYVKAFGEMLQALRSTQ